MNLEEIMKPYFAKKLELDKKYKTDEEFINKCLEEKRFIELRLERLRDNKEQEIQQYISKNLSPNRPDFGSMIRRDLEQSYANKELELETRINELDKEIAAQRSKVPSEIDKFYRLDVRELVQIKGELRKPLIAAKKELEMTLKETQLKFDTIMLKLSNFKYTYDENHRVLNGNEYKKLFDESHSLVEVKYNIQNQLKKIDEYLGLTGLTKEETSVIMMSMTPWEKEEYDRRKALNNDEQIEKISNEEEQPIEEETEEKQNEDEVVEKKEEVEENLKDKVDNELLETIFVDIMKSAKQLRTIKLSQDGKAQYLSTKENGDYEAIGNIDEENKVQLPNGIYLNEKDIKEALKNYGKQSKGRTFKVTVLNGTYEISKNVLKTVKKSLRDCSIIKLLREKKLGSFDIKRVYGKVAGEKYSKKAQLGEVKTDMPTGNYINIDDFGKNLKTLLVEKGPSWISIIGEKIKKGAQEYLDFREKQQQDALELNDDYTIKKTR